MLFSTTYYMISYEIRHEAVNPPAAQSLSLEPISENTSGNIERKESTPPPDDEIQDDMNKSNPLRFINEIPSPVKTKVNQYLIDTINSQLEAKRKQGFDLTEVIIVIFILTAIL